MLVLQEHWLLNADEMLGEAWAAMSRQDSSEALRLWRMLREEYPDRSEGYIWPIQVLWQGGQLEDAETMAAEALARFPEHPDILVQYGWIATVREDWEGALQWWAATRARAPDRPECYLWSIRALWKLARFSEAEKIAAEAIERFPGNTDVTIERAWIAVNAGKWDVALGRWHGVLTAEPGRREAQAGLIQAMRCLGQTTEAEDMAAMALARLPHDPLLLVEHIWTAVDRADWSAVSSRLEAAREHLLEAGLFQSTSEAVQARRQSALENTSTAHMTRVMADSGADALSDTELMLMFESIGERCDLGAVQRHFGAEPTGLLRFAFSPFDGLISALRDRFEAIGTAEDTGFEIYDDELILTTNKYGLAFHTSVLKNDVAVSLLDGKIGIWRVNTPKAFDAHREQQRDRLVVSKHKLLNTLEEGRKIFVHASDERTSEDDAAHLFAAVGAYGPNALLYIRPATRAHPACSVIRLQDGLYLGHYAGLTDFVAGQQPAFDVWLRLLRRTYSLAQKSSPGYRPAAVSS